jgi:hypothetical protein
LRTEANSQNRQCWSADNVKLSHELAAHDEKFGVWCEISAHIIIGPMFHDDTITAANKGCKVFPASYRTSL